jgi:SsrA-binding protein
MKSEESVEQKYIARNKKAWHDYDIMEKVEAGIQLIGSEVKSIRQGGLNLADCYAQCDNGEIHILHLHIAPYGRSGMFVPDPYRKRKLLLHHREIARLSQEVDRKQLTIIPLSVYFKKHWVKVELGLCRGRKKFDKRQKIAEKESRRRIDKLLKNRM